MDMDRVRRWKCLYCGSKLKRKLDVVDTNNKIIGYSLMCCNCGHLDNFALSSSALPMFICGQHGSVSKINIKCPLSNDELQFCKNFRCNYRPGWKGGEPKEPAVSKEIAKDSLTMIRKYE